MEEETDCLIDIMETMTNVFATSNKAKKTSVEKGI